MEMEKSKVLIQFLVIFRQSGDVLSFLHARRLRGYTATMINKPTCYHRHIFCPPILLTIPLKMMSGNVLVTVVAMLDNVPAALEIALELTLGERFV